MAHKFSKEQFWRRTLADWQASGLSVRQYCHRHDLSEPSFYCWRRQLKLRDATGDQRRSPRSGTPDAQPLFLPIVVSDAAAAAGLEVVLANARLIRVRPGFDRDTLAQLLRVLEEQPC
jgi:transposase-like protein